MTGEDEQRGEGEGEIEVRLRGGWREGKGKVRHIEGRRARVD